MKKVKIMMSDNRIRIYNATFADLNTKMYPMKKNPYLITAIILFACSHVSNHDAVRLNMVDSLIVEEKYDSAYHEIINMDTHFENDEERAHYQLLLAQTSYLTDNTLSSYSVIDSAIAYYEKSNNKEKMADCYYYKAACLHERNKPENAITFYKKAEESAQETDNLRLKYKIAESLVRINSQNGNYNLQLDYARKALGHALKSGNNNWIAYSYFNLSKTFQNLGNRDSLSFYAKKLIPRLDDIYTEDLPHFLSCIGFMYFVQGDMDMAKKYYKESLSHKEIAITLGNLADVYDSEGNEDEAYKLWKKAFLLNDGSRKDIIIYNMLSYDLEHEQNLEHACERLYDIFAIKDSMSNALKDHTILELQHDYDEETQNQLHENRIMKWMIATLIMLVLLLLLLSYIKYKQYQTKLTIAKHQMLISQYTNQISLLKTSGENAEKQIKELNNQIEDNIKRNNALEETCTDAELQIRVYKDKISDIVEKASPILNRGKILYESIVQGQTSVRWNKYDFKCFVEYYKAIHLMEYESMEKVYGRLTTRNAFFLILSEMGKDNKEISNIMGISPESIRSIRFRLNKKK